MKIAGWSDLPFHAYCLDINSTELIKITVKHMKLNNVGFMLQSRVCNRIKQRSPYVPTNNKAICKAFSQFFFIALLLLLYFLGATSNFVPCYSKRARKIGNNEARLSSDWVTLVRPFSLNRCFSHHWITSFIINSHPSIIIK